jgi:RNA polymerase subunit RPABC4/transcription elongation factor Spt4
MENLSLESIFLAITVYAGMVLAAFWLAMIIWAYRDMRARSRDTLAQFIVAVMVALLNVPGLLIYIFLRPRETLAEAYERSLEEEALLQEIEDKPVCPGCGQRVQSDWQACPHCHTRLKKACHNCGKMLDLSWNLCPHCAAGQVNYPPEPQSRASHVRPATVPEDWRSRAAYQEPTAPAPRRAADPLEFIEGDEY